VLDCSAQNAQTGLGALAEMQSRGANGQSHTSLLSSVPPSKWDTWFGCSRWWHCGLDKKHAKNLMTRSAQTKKMSF